MEKGLDWVFQANGSSFTLGLKKVWRSHRRRQLQEHQSAWLLPLAVSMSIPAEDLIWYLSSFSLRVLRFLAHLRRTHHREPILWCEVYLKLVMAILSLLLKWKWHSLHGYVSNIPVAGFPTLRIAYINTLATTQVKKIFNIKFAYDVYSGYVDSYVLNSVQSNPLVIT